MVTLTVRNLPDEVYRALRVRATLHGRSIETEVRAILKEVTLPERRDSLGSVLATIGQRARLTDEELANFLHRDATPGRTIDLE